MGPKAFAMDGFDFKAVVPAFHCIIIVAMTFFAHAANQLMLSEKLLINA
jgi:hypothetical protein